ncbi:hypothetical protein J8273_1886 [Carpediemonas membranifera]|uniref:Abnormal spindle-like microcephaly-associated protein ASH domain-containing protein n=1 Tax=Carpediemonas membranifera TaxID=201153 RepID=A0A8J6BAS7_9EUKA|nr:hypothetical protein J8273_1886 [Carpediemonas membranifera]|eukprot:KAG9396839.1 hypothetical protein J8273_1886 [Carpediemonas membranifera]
MMQANAVVDYFRCLSHPISADASSVHLKALHSLFHSPEPVVRHLALLLMTESAEALHALKTCILLLPGEAAPLLNSISQAIYTNHDTTALLATHLLASLAEFVDPAKLSSLFADLRQTLSFYSTHGLFSATSPASPASSNGTSAHIARLQWVTGEGEADDRPMWAMSRATVVCRLLQSFTMVLPHIRAKPHVEAIDTILCAALDGEEMAKATALTGLALFWPATVSLEERRARLGRVYQKVLPLTAAELDKPTSSLLSDALSLFWSIWSPRMSTKLFNALPSPELVPEFIKDQIMASSDLVGESDLISRLHGSTAESSKPTMSAVLPASHSVVISGVSPQGLTLGSTHPFRTSFRLSCRSGPSRVIFVHSDRPDTVRVKPSVLVLGPDPTIVTVTCHTTQLAATSRATLTVLAWTGVPLAAVPVTVHPPIISLPFASGTEPLDLGVVAPGTVRRLPVPIVAGGVTPTLVSFLPVALTAGKIPFRIFPATLFAEPGQTALGTVTFEPPVFADKGLVSGSLSIGSSHRPLCLKATVGMPFTVSKEARFGFIQKPVSQIHYSRMILVANHTSTPLTCKFIVTNRLLAVNPVTVAPHSTTTHVINLKPIRGGPVDTVVYATAPGCPYQRIRVSALVGPGIYCRIRQDLSLRPVVLNSPEPTETDIPISCFKSFATQFSVSCTGPFTVSAVTEDMDTASKITGAGPMYTIQGRSQGTLRLRFNPDSVGVSEGAVQVTSESVVTTILKVRCIAIPAAPSAEFIARVQSWYRADRDVRERAIQLAPFKLTDAGDPAFLCQRDTLYVQHKASTKTTAVFKNNKNSNISYFAFVPHPFTFDRGQVTQSGFIAARGTLSLPVMLGEVDELEQSYVGFVTIVPLDCREPTTATSITLVGSRQPEVDVLTTVTHPMEGSVFFDPDAIDTASADIVLANMTARMVYVHAGLQQPIADDGKFIVTRQDGPASTSVAKRRAGTALRIDPFSEASFTAHIMNIEPGTHVRPLSVRASYRPIQQLQSTSDYSWAVPVKPLTAAFGPLPVRLSDKAVDFGVVLSGMKTRLPLTLWNDSAQDIDITAEITGTTAHMFKIAGNKPAFIPALGQTTIQVQVRPGGNVPFSATLTIRAFSEVHLVPLTGFSTELQISAAIPLKSLAISAVLKEAKVLSLPDRVKYQKISSGSIDSVMIPTDGTAPLVLDGGLREGSSQGVAVASLVLTNDSLHPLTVIQLTASPGSAVVPVSTHTHASGAGVGDLPIVRVGAEAAGVKLPVGRTTEWQERMKVRGLIMPLTLPAGTVLVCQLAFHLGQAGSRQLWVDAIFTEGAINKRLIVQTDPLYKEGEEVDYEIAAQLRPEDAGLDSPPKPMAEHIAQATPSPRYLRLPVTLRVSPPLQISDTAVSFGKRPVGVTHVETVRLTNPGLFPLMWKVRAADKAHAKDKVFSFYPSSGTVASGHSAEIEATFTPDSQGRPIERAFSVVTSLGAYPMTVSGECVRASLVSSATEVDLTNVVVGQTRSFTIPLSNSGQLPARVEMAVVNLDHRVIDITPLQLSVAPGAHASVTVRFTPHSEGTFCGRLEFRYDPSNSQGRGRTMDALSLAVFGRGGYPALQFDDVLDCGLLLYRRPTTVRFEVHNSGTADADVSFFSRAGNVDIPSRVSIPAESCTMVPVTVTPRSFDPLAIPVTVTCPDDKRLKGGRKVELKAVTGVPVVSATPDVLSSGLVFGTSLVGVQSSKSFSLLNQGSIALPFSFIIPEGVKDGIFTVVPMNGTLEINSPVSITVSFVPESINDALDIPLMLKTEYKTFKLPVSAKAGDISLSLGAERSMDFGVCRAGESVCRTVVLMNSGDIDADIAVRVVDPANPADSVANQTDMMTREILRKQSLYLTAMNLVVHGGRRGRLTLTFSPPHHAQPMKTTCRLHLVSAKESFTIPVTAACDVPAVKLAKLSGQARKPEGEAPLDGTRTPVLLRLLKHNFHLVPVGSSDIVEYSLANNSPFTVRFFVHSSANKAFTVSGTGGVIQPYSTGAVVIKFSPTTDSICKGRVTILFGESEREGRQYHVDVIGVGGQGFIAASFVHESDIHFKGLDFNVVPVSVPVQRRFRVTNQGTSEATLTINSNSSEFSFCVVPPDRENEISVPDGYFGQQDSFDIQPAESFLMAVRMEVLEPRPYVAALTIASQWNRLFVPIRGKGGKVDILHEGDLDLGPVAIGQVQTRRIVLRNRGTVPCDLLLHWAVPGIASAPQHRAHIWLPAVPRGSAARVYWALIRDRFTDGSLLSSDFIEKSAKRSAHDLWSIVRHAVLSSFQPAQGPATETEIGSMSAISRATRPESAHRISNIKGILHAARPGFMDAIRRTDIALPVVPDDRPFLQVSPVVVPLPPGVRQAVTVRIRCATASPITGVLQCSSSVPDAPHLIPLSATPKVSRVMATDTSPLDWGRIPIGDSVVMSRSFRNLGEMEINWRIRNTNIGLTVSPARGVLKPKEEVGVSFVFMPLQEQLQKNPVFFEHDAGPPLSLSVIAGGGTARLVVPERFDFGRAMIGQSTQLSIPLKNEGTARLRVLLVELDESVSFRTGSGWPADPFAIPPGGSYDLPLSFTPQGEKVAPGKLTITTALMAHSVQLRGGGREASISFEPKTLSFNSCIVGNEYQRQMVIHNTGDVTYHINFGLVSVNGKTLADFGLSVTPAELTLNAYEKHAVTVDFCPFADVNEYISMLVQTNISEHTIGISLESGRATVYAKPNVVDIGLIQLNSAVTRQINLFNDGSAAINFRLITARLPKFLSLSPVSGTISSDDSVSVRLHIKPFSTPTSFSHEIVIDNDLKGAAATVVVKGRAEESRLDITLLHPLGFGNVCLGHSMARSFVLSNRGGYPLDFEAHPPFSIVANPSVGSVPAFSQTEVAVTWAPTTVGPFQFKMAVKANDETHHIELFGKVHKPRVRIVPKGGLLDFGTCAATIRYEGDWIDNIISKKFTISNPDPIFPITLKVSSASSKVFKIGADEVTVAPGDSVSVPVDFYPAKTRGAASSILSLDGIQLSRRMELSGKLGVPGLRLTMGQVEVKNGKEIALGELGVAWPALCRLSLRNYGSVPLDLTFTTTALTLAIGVDGTMVKERRLSLRPKADAEIILAVTPLRTGPGTAAIALDSDLLTPLSFTLAWTGAQIKLPPKAIPLIAEVAGLDLDDSAIDEEYPPAEVLFGRLVKPFEFVRDVSMQAVTDLPMVALVGDSAASTEYIPPPEP